ncbi:MAG: NAD(P)/FAD-dependent oxidoreductase, partial [Chloroflexota bacterium]
MHNYLSKCEMQKDYDVIVVGGRVAGSTTAAFLGKAGVRVLLLERDQLPKTHPASSPMIQPVTMAMLDEIGADERAYARATPPIHTMYGIDRDIRWEMPIPMIEGRDYAYAIDRARFDAALWENAVRYDSVDGIMRFSVTNILWDNIGKTVIGVAGKNLDTGEQQQFAAKVVVGADGRFSMIARKVEAQERDKEEENPTSLYYAYWRGVAALDGANGSTSVAYGSNTNTHGYLIMDSADDTTAVVVEGRADVIEPLRGETQSFYLQKLAENRRVWDRLENAEMVTDVHGMKRIGNMFRQAGGDGWALVGDAYHQKDPIDGQGIYDSVYTARTLAKALNAWLSGETSYDEAIAWYDEKARKEMDPQYEMTLRRIQQNLYPTMTLP